MNRTALYRVAALMTALMILLLGCAQAMAETVTYDAIYSSSNFNSCLILINIR